MSLHKIVLFGITCMMSLVSFSQADTIAPETDVEILAETIERPDTFQLSEIDIFSFESKIYINDIQKRDGISSLMINGENKMLTFDKGQAVSDLSFDAKGKLIFCKLPSEGNFKLKLYHVSSKKDSIRLRHLPLWLSILPPLLAIILALIFKEVIISLFVGIWTGAFIVGGLRIDSIYYFIYSFFQSLQKYIVEALIDTGHMSVIVFSMLIGGMVAIISKNGGMAGVVYSLSRYAKGSRSSQFITWILGVAIFFDDYANTLIVGNTMRSVTDKFRVSREKLAYIVDSTAAPVSAIAFITTWIGAELGYIDDGIKAGNIPLDMTPYSIFLSSLKYSFYPVLTLSFILLIIYFRKDFGSMYHAEKRARQTGRVSPALTTDDDEPNMEDLSPIKNAPLKWYNAVIPVLVVIFMTIFGLIDTGIDAIYNELVANEVTNINASWSSVWSNLGILLAPDQQGFFSKLGQIIGSADPYVGLLWASLSGVVVAIALTLSARIMKLFDAMHWMVTGFKTMMPALIILTLAWALAITTHELHTAEYLSSALQNTINPFFFPVIIFVMAAFIAFSTGSSWSTMAILYPIAIPTSYAICLANNLDVVISTEILLNVIATVLAASVLGDHCSPISDTTILSSLASDCNHIDHVRTQLPYAITVGIISMCCVGLATYLGGKWWISFVLYLIAIGIFILIIRIFGKSVEEYRGEDITS